MSGKGRGGGGRLTSGPAAQMQRVQRLNPQHKAHRALPHAAVWVSEAIDVTLRGRQQQQEGGLPDG